MASIDWEFTTRYSGAVVGVKMATRSLELNDMKFLISTALPLMMRRFIKVPGVVFNSNFSIDVNSDIRFHHLSIGHFKSLVFICYKMFF